ncbi:MAG: hypothetical protein ABEJ62_01915, partial [Candidatus Nanohaloarchaea archaeon]
VATYQGNEFGVTFLGDELNATVSKPDSSTVRASIDAPRLRIYLHDSNYSAGKRRAELFTRGKIVFGAENNLRGASVESIDQLSGYNEKSFEDALSLKNFEYNLTFGSMERGSQVPYQTVVVSDRPSVLLGRYGNYSRIENRVALWR